MPTAGITSDVVEEIKARNIDAGIINKLEEFFSYSDSARFAPSSIKNEEMHKIYKLLEEIIDSIERIRV